MKRESLPPLQANQVSTEVVQLREFFFFHLGTVLGDEPFELLELLIRSRANHSIPQPRLVSGIGSTNRGNMLAVWLDDVFSSVSTADNKASIIRLYEHIIRSRPLNIVDYLAGWATLSRTQASMLALWNARVP